MSLTTNAPHGVGGSPAVPPPEGVGCGPALTQHALAGAGLRRMDKLQVALAVQHQGIDH